MLVRWFEQFHKPGCLRTVYTLVLNHLDLSNATLSRTLARANRHGVGEIPHILKNIDQGSKAWNASMLDRGLGNALVCAR